MNNLIIIYSNNLSKKCAIVSSHVFLLISILLAVTGYSMYLIYLQLLQYFLTILPWSGIFDASIIRPFDRGIAIINIILLGMEHIRRGNNLNDMILAGSITFTFLIMHWYCRQLYKLIEDKPSIWYLFWHINICINNFLLVSRGRTIELYYYAIEFSIIFGYNNIIVDVIL